jgi:hypothetical protein
LDDFRADGRSSTTRQASNRRHQASSPERILADRKRGLTRTRSGTDGRPRGVTRFEQVSSGGGEIESEAHRGRSGHSANPTGRDGVHRLLLDLFE